ncbi:MAG: FecR family protein, partial [Campylobacterota bacterium]|nr:FecR family protein [Campylobacterota bacterium]
MKTLLLLLISSIITLANVGKITAIKGEVYIDRDSKKIVASVGSILQLKDVIKTENKSKALILFNDKTSITIGKKSTLTVEDYVFDTINPKKSKATFGFGQGVFRTITGKIGKLNKDKFKIKTSTASIGIRGTNFIVKVSPDGIQMGVQDGAIFFVPKGSTQAIDIQKGFKVTFD